MIGLTIATCVLAVTVALIVWLQQIERNRWATERHQLVDRIIAKHAGEVMALDRTPKPGQSPDHPVFERPVAVGL